MEMEDRRGGGRKRGLCIGPKLPGRRRKYTSGVEDVVLTAQHPFGQKDPPFRCHHHKDCPEVLGAKETRRRGK